MSNQYMIELLNSLDLNELNSQELSYQELQIKFPLVSTSSSRKQRRNLEMQALKLWTNQQLTQINRR